MNDSTDLSLAFRVIREDFFGMSQHSFGHEIGASRQQVSRVETGKSHYRYDQIQAIERATGMSMDQLLAQAENSAAWLPGYLQLSPKQRRAMDAYILAGLQLVKDSQ